MDELRARTQEDLESVIEGELRFDPVGRAPYAVDGSIYEIDPFGVVIPRSWDDVRQVLNYAAKQGMVVHPRGSGTGLAGESLGRGLILDFSRHFRRILSINAESVVVEPGVVVGDINRKLAALGRRLGPDPSGMDYCTAGGLVASDSSGARSLRYGSTADHVERLRVMFANGEETELGVTPWSQLESEDEPSGRFVDGVARKIAALAHRNSELITKRWPRSPRNRCGYAIKSAIRPEGLDLARLVIGSEGTLAIVTEVQLKTVPIPSGGAAVLLRFGRLSDAAAAVQDCLLENPSACEMHDWRSLSLVRDSTEWAKELIDDETAAVLVVEFEDHESVAQAEAKAWRLANRMSRSGVLVDSPYIATDLDERERLLGLRRVSLPELLKRPGRSKAVPLIEDIAVPPENLAVFVKDLQNILKRHEVSWTLYAHAGHGQLHVRPFLDLSHPLDIAKIEPLATEAYERVFEHGGTISGEHGCGLARSQFIARQYGELIHVFREIKAAFDPLHLLNPGKIIAEDHHQITRDLRVWLRDEPLETGEVVSGEPHSNSSTAKDQNGKTKSDRWKLGSKIKAKVKIGESRISASTALPVLSETLIWQDRTMDETINACNGCGACRSGDPTLRMCPTFRALNSEAATPRAQANLLRQVASGAIDPRFWGSEELKRNADLCIHCGLCRIECPAGVDVSRLMIEAKSAYVNDHGLNLTDWILSRLESLTRMASRTPWLYNKMLFQPRTRWLMERTMGLSRHRCLPKLASRSFLKRAKELGLTRPNPSQPGPRVAYFVDMFANYFDPELAETTVELLQSFGVNVYVPSPQRGSGMSALIVGDVDHARDIALANLRPLANAVRDGYTVICSEPTAAMMLRREYKALTNDLDADIVSKNVMDVAEYLAALDSRGLIPKPKIAISARVGYHQPCHLRALDIGTPGLDLIRQIPDLKAEFIDRGCSGMAGAFGMSRRNFLTSLRAGRGLMTRLRDDDIEIGATECGACRLQMEQGVTKRTFHPLKLLAIAHGLNPQLRLKLKESKDRHEIA